MSPPRMTQSPAPFACSAWLAQKRALLGSTPGCRRNQAAVGDQIKHKAATLLHAHTCMQVRRAAALHARPAVVRGSHCASSHGESWPRCCHARTPKVTLQESRILSYWICFSGRPRRRRQLSVSNRLSSKNLRRRGSNSTILVNAHSRLACTRSSSVRSIEQSMNHSG